MLRLLLLASVMGPAPTSPSPEPEVPAAEPEASAVDDVAFAVVGDWAQLSPETLEWICGRTARELFAIT